ncbi:hypothetical protein HMPREF9370_0098 [Neisseria wadsworthii 9715]|uniref:Uncharacterized protein n=1 Tax=Neisseria wadsworthii 9715 TaxID=1030841 RepID=G4CLY9_9NEIS|nr:hypothetical protein HMPREF9370_0098 [Neisseria wadsworthii 9715]
MYRNKNACLKNFTDRHFYIIIHTILVNEIIKTGFSSFSFLFC